MLAARLARERSDEGYRTLAHAISRHAGVTVFLTDRLLNDSHDVQAERLAQWCELCSQITPTIAICQGDESRSQPRPELERVDIAIVPKDADLVESAHALLRELEQSREIAEVVIAVGGESGPMLWSSLRPHYSHITLDTWLPRLAQISAGCSYPPASDIWLAPDGIRISDGGRHLSTTAFHRLPRALSAWKNEHPLGAIVVLCAPDEYDRIGIEKMLSKTADSYPIRIVTLSVNADSDLEARFFDSLVACRKPEVIIAVGNDPRASSVCQSLAALSATRCLVVSMARFPSILKRNDGRMRLCRTYEDLVAHVTDAEEISRGVSKHHEGSGWLTYSQMLAARSSRTIQGGAEVSGLMDLVPNRGIPRMRARLSG